MTRCLVHVRGQRGYREEWRPCEVVDVETRVVPHPREQMSAAGYTLTCRMALVLVEDEDLPRWIDAGRLDGEDEDEED